MQITADCLQRQGCLHAGVWGTRPHCGGCGGSSPSATSDDLLHAQTWVSGFLGNLLQQVPSSPPGWWDQALNVVKQDHLSRPAAESGWLAWHAGACAALSTACACGCRHGAARREQIGLPGLCCAARRKDLECLGLSVACISLHRQRHPAILPCMTLSAV